MILMKEVKYLIGSNQICDKPMPVYSDIAVDFLDDLSLTIMKNKFNRIYSDIVTLAYWCRKSNILKLKEKCEDSNIRLGRGLCFHIAPSNIPINFVFSYIFGVLAGCSNIVRIPSKTYPQVEIICNILKEVLDRHVEIKKRTSFIKYPSNNDITGYFSKIADLRLIWGGDETIKSIKSLETKPRCIDIAFADRYSISIINADMISTASDEELSKLAQDFYNDTYLMDQNACSSPYLIMWLNDDEQSRNKFWDKVFSNIKDKYYISAGIAMDKYVKLCEDSINLDYIDKIHKHENLIYRIELKSLVKNILNLRGFGGYFYEYSLTNIDEIKTIVTDKLQTLTVYGIESEKLRDYVISNNLTGIDRIVPIGKAMDIGIVWDGYDLIRTMSRIISLT